MQQTQDADAAASVSSGAVLLFVRLFAVALLVLFAPRPLRRRPLRRRPSLAHPILPLRLCRVLRRFHPIPPHSAPSVSQFGAKFFGAKKENDDDDTV